MNKTFKYIVLLALACFVGKANALELKTEVFSLLNLDVSLFIMKKGSAQKLKSLSIGFSFLGTPFRHVAFIL